MSEKTLNVCPECKKEIPEQAWCKVCKVCFFCCKAGTDEMPTHVTIVFG